MDLYKNSNLPLQLRVEDLLDKMTIEEKAAQLYSLFRPALEPAVEKDGNISVEMMNKLMPHRIGEISASNFLFNDFQAHVNFFKQSSAF